MPFKCDVQPDILRNEWLLFVVNHENKKNVIVQSHVQVKNQLSSSLRLC